MKVAIMQPTYLPWLGYFDMIDQADVFVLLDTVPISKKSWQTRNRIRGRDGKVVWLSIPTHAHRGQLLKDVLVADKAEWVKHRRTIQFAYGHAPSPPRFTYHPTPFPLHLAGLTGAFIKAIALELAVPTIIKFASQMEPTSADPIRRIIDICHQLGADTLLNTPGAREWMEPHLNQGELAPGLRVEWHEYEHPIYSQGDLPWQSHLSIVDCLAWHGPDTLEIIRSGRRNQVPV